MRKRRRPPFARSSTVRSTPSGSAKLPFVVLVDRYGIAARAYVQEGRTISIPSLFLIDKRGVLRRRIRGRNDAAFAALRKEIAKLLAH